MRRHLVFVVALAALSRSAPGAEKSWIFRPSAYTHDPRTGERVNQFAEPAPAYIREDPTYQQSAYRHSRSSLSIGDSYDYLHVVETWGQGESIRPYGEWLYPYRPGATPYGPWEYPGAYPGNYPGMPGPMPLGPWASPYGTGQYNRTWAPWGFGPNMAPAPQFGTAPFGGPRAAPPQTTPRTPPGRVPNAPRGGSVDY